MYCGVHNLFAKACVLDSSNLLLSVFNAQVPGGTSSVLFGGAVSPGTEPESYLQQTIARETGISVCPKQFISYQFYVDSRAPMKNSYDLYLYYLVFVQPAHTSAVKSPHHSWIPIHQIWHKYSRESFGAVDQEFLTYLNVMHHLLKS